LWVLDEPRALTKKIKSAVTDPGREVVADPEGKPGVTNLLTILSAATGTPVPALEQAYAGKGYGDLKADVAQAVVELFAPVRERYEALVADPAALDAVLADGAERARAVATPMLERVRDAVGLLRPVRA
jgi:tryptophanyl-tRNA synthetase